MKVIYVPTKGGVIVNARQGKGFLLPPPACLCMQEPDTGTASLPPSFWQLVLFVSLPTQQTKHRKVPASFSLSQRIGSVKRQNSAGGCKCRCLYCFLSQCCLRTNRTGAPCAGYYSQTVAPETTSLPLP